MDNGFNSPTTDEPLAGNPRVHEEGRQNYERNNRSSDWFAPKNEIPDAKPESRLRSDAARANAEKNRGTIQEDLRQQNGDHHENADRLKQDINNHIENFTNLEVSPKPITQVKSVDAEEHNGREHDPPSASVNHVHTSPASDLNHLPPLRLELNQRDNVDRPKVGAKVTKSEKNKISKESKLGRLHKESSGSGWDQSPPHHRLRAEGEDIAKRNNTDSITEIFLHNNNSPEPKEIKVLNSAAATYTPRKPPTPRIRPDGLQNLQRSMNHSEMSAIMHGSPVDPKLPRPSTGRKILPHMQRSELW
uniref:Uncharacterized protein n=1 Tax=Arion vulgaris TaxID=1028688 RepID=A0A0B7A8J2_9EUPU